MLWPIVFESQCNDQRIDITSSFFKDVILGDGQDINDELIMFEQHRSEYINILRELRHKHPNMPMTELEALAEEEVMNRGPKSRAFYRIQATRKLTGGGGNIIKQKLEKQSKNGKYTTIVSLILWHIYFRLIHYIKLSISPEI